MDCQHVPFYVQVSQVDMVLSYILVIVLSKNPGNKIIQKLGKVTSTFVLWYFINSLSTLQVLVLSYLGTCA